MTEMTAEGYAVRKALGLAPEADGADVLAEIGWLQQSATPPPAGSGVVVDKDALVGELRSIIEWVSERDHNKAIALDQVVYDLETRAAGSGVAVDREELASAMHHALEEAVRARGVTPVHVYADIEAVAGVALAEIERQRDELAHVKAGDPDPTPEDGNCPARVNYFSCTRTAGHPGQHIAGGGTRVEAVWRDDVQRVS